MILCSEKQKGALKKLHNLLNERVILNSRMTSEEESHNIARASVRRL